MGEPSRTETTVRYVWDRERPQAGSATVVEVLWLDATSLGHAEWEHSSEVESAEMAKVITVGYLWEETEDHIKVVGSMTTTDQHGAGVTIPMGCVEAIRKVRP